MKRLRKLLGVLLGLSIITATAATSIAETMTIYEGADENDPDIVCPDGYERVPYDGGVAFRSKVTETPDLTALTPTEHNEYAEGDFYIVEDVYVQTDEPSDASVSATGGWEYSMVTVNHSIYDDSDKNYGTLYATMTVTAQFKWNGETAEVVGTPSYYTKITPDGEKRGITKKDKKKTQASDQGSNFLFGNKYAYVEYVVTLTYHFDLPSLSGEFPIDFRLYVSMNRNGKMNTEN